MELSVKILICSFIYLSSVIVQAHSRVSTGATEAFTGPDFGSKYTKNKTLTDLHKPPRTWLEGVKILPRLSCLLSTLPLLRTKKG